MKDLTKELFIGDEQFTHCDVLKICGKGYENIFKRKTTLKAWVSAKDTKKSYCDAVLNPWYCKSIKGFNCLVSRNTIALLDRTTIETYHEVFERLNNDGYLNITSITDRTKSNSSKKRFIFENGNKIMFNAFESEVSGINCGAGFFGKWTFEEPIEANPSEKVNYRTQYKKMGELIDSVFRSYPHGYIIVPCCNKKIEIDMMIDFLFNPWDDKHWINKKNKNNPSSGMVESIFPWTEEHQQLIIDNPEKNYYASKIDTNFPLPKGSGVEVIRLTKFCNEFRDKREDERNKQRLSEGNPFFWTTIAGKEYDGNDPDLYVWRDCIKHKSLLNDNYFKVGCDNLIVIGLDAGKNDNNAVAFMKSKKVDKETKLYAYKFKGYKNNSNLDDLRVAYKVIDIIIDEIKNHSVETKFVLSYDDHAGLLAYTILKNVKELFGKNFPLRLIVAPKKNEWDIIRRVMIIKYNILNNNILINKDNPEMVDEFLTQQYGSITVDGFKKRDELHYKVDYQNALEYATSFYRFNLKIPSQIGIIKIGTDNLKSDETEKQYGTRT